jgi:DNA-binding transcriptional LysR family regulator
MAICRHRSFTRAAEHERVAQPSLSQQIRKLEDELGARLFDRLGRKIRLTRSASAFRSTRAESLTRLRTRAGVKFLEFKSPKPLRTVGWVRLKDRLLNPGVPAFVEILETTSCGFPPGES